MKDLSECKLSLDNTLEHCDSNDAKNIEIYLIALRKTCSRAIEHILDLDYSYIKENFDTWDEYLMEEIGINYDDFKILTLSELPDIFNEEE